MHRQGVTFTEEQQMKAMIAAGKTWPQIRPHLTHIDEEYVKENLYDPLAKQFKETGKLTVIDPSAHEKAAFGAVAEARKYATARAELDKKAAELAAREKALAEREKELGSIEDLTGEKKGKGKQS